MKRKLVWFCSALFLLTVFSTSTFATEPTVRVAILQEVPSVRVTVLAPCRLVDLSTGMKLAEWPSLKWQEVRASNPGLKVGQMDFPMQALSLEPTQQTILRVNARPYRGGLILHRTPKGNVTVVNRLDLEEYLVSALGSEVSPRWPTEALKAHAVVSRTMIAHRIWIQKQKDLPFDVTADTGVHLYHGVSAERGRTRSAVQATEGQVLSYAGELLSATFHANCGGHTEDAKELWEGKGDPAPLQGKPDPYCRDLRHYRWQTTIPLGKFMEALGNIGQEIGDLQSFEILERNRSGRVRTIRLGGTMGSVEISGRRLRELLGANRLRSLNFTVRTTPLQISFNGLGWGHGVGLCQWGAYGQARHGKTMDEILSFYFPGAQRRKLQGLPGFSS